MFQGNTRCKVYNENFEEKGCVCSTAVMFELGGNSIKDEALNFLMRECPRLVDINLAGCMPLTNKCLFGRNPDLRIERLNHAGCYKLTYDGFNRPLLSVHPDVIFYVDTKLFGTTVQVLDA